MTRGIQTEFSTLSSLTEDVQVSAPHVATPSKSKTPPQPKSQEYLCSRKGLRHGTLELAGIRDRNFSTIGATKLNESTNLMHQRKSRRTPTPQFQTKKGETLLAYYSSPRGREGYGICVGGWGWPFCEDRGFEESADEKGMRSITNNKGEVTTYSNPTCNAAPKLTANSCRKFD